MLLMMFSVVGHGEVDGATVTRASPPAGWEDSDTGVGRSQHL